MVYLHENREEFTNAVNLASEYFHILPIIAEKDYYVTMILRELSEPDDAVQTAVLMETSFAEVSFPTVVLPVHSYIGDMMAEEAPEALENFGLEPLEMKVQGLDRTLADKVFAICDYYTQDRMKKHSRHIYDIYKLLQIVPQTDVNVPEMLNFLIENEVYKEDYENITARILEEGVSYDVAIEAIKKIAESGMFE